MPYPGDKVRVRHRGRWRYGVVMTRTVMKDGEIRLVVQLDDGSMWEGAEKDVQG